MTELTRRKRTSPILRENPKVLERALAASR